jgi:ATP-dependent helicase IRC3
VDKLLLVNPDCTVGVVKAEENELFAPVVVGSVQTLSRTNRLEQMVPEFNTVIIDEAYHAPAPTYQRVMEYLGCFEPDGPLTVGFTATPERADKVGLGKVWERIVYQKPLIGMIIAGYLSDLRAMRITLKADLDQVHTQHGDFIDSELESALLNADAPEHIVAAYQTHASGRRALVFTPTVKMAHAVAEAFQGAEITAEALDGTTPLGERRDILDRLSSGDTKVVANCVVLTEGFDEPSIGCIIIARPTKSKPLYIQMVGRGTRPYPGKTDCLVLDVVGVTKRHSIMTASEIFNLDLRSRSVKEAVEYQEQRERVLGGGEAGFVNGELVAQHVDLFGSRPMRWVQTRAGTWALSLGDGFVRLALSQDGRWDVHYQENGERPLLLRSGLPLGYAQGVAEDFARKRGAEGLLNPSARWRSDPASDKQLAWLRWRWVPVQAGLTKGAAPDLIAVVRGG